MTRLLRPTAIGMLLAVLVLAAGPPAGAQDATPSPVAPMSAAAICNQAVQVATPVAGSVSLPVGASFDLAFIDLMIAHHQQAIALATIALERGEHGEIIEFAQHTVETQQEQIDQLTVWRSLWYPGFPALTSEQAVGIFDQVAANSPGRGGVPGAAEMTLAPDVMGLCGANPGEVDLAFIDRMTLHLSGALLLAHAAVTFAEHAEIQNYAGIQIAALQTDVDALYAWRLLWFPEATPGDLG